MAQGGPRLIEASIAQDLQPVIDLVLQATRTFYKAYGLAALSVGYAVASAEITDVLNRVRAPFNVNSLGLAAATAVLNDEAYLAQGRQVNLAGMEQLLAAGAEMRLG